MSTAKIVALIVAFFAAIGAIIYLTLNFQIDLPYKGDGMKRLSYTVAEGLVYKAHNEPFPRASCDACRTGKLKAGVFSLGAFDVIEVDNLVVNLPKDFAMGNDVATKEGNTFVETLDLNPLLSISNVKVKKKFYGIKVNGFSLNIVEGDKSTPVVSARLVKNSGKRIVLKDVSLFSDKGEISVPEAELVTEPKLYIKWASGVFDLRF